MNIIEFSKITIKDLNSVGGKNSSLGEMRNTLVSSGVPVPDGFAITADAYRDFLHYNDLNERLKEQLDQLDIKNFENLPDIGLACRKLINDSVMSPALEKDILTYFESLQKKYDHPITVAVRSSATAEDLPYASFAGQHDSFLNVGAPDLILKCRSCYASLFNDRAIKYRVQMGFDHMKIALSIGVQKMVRSDLGAAGVAFTIEPETGFKDFIYITGIWGLGENIVQGAVTPDEFFLFKPSLRNNKNAIITQKCGEKSHTLIFANDDTKTINMTTPPEMRESFVLNKNEIELLGKWCLAIEDHYGTPMDIEWAKDGIDGKLFIVQARPETVHQGKKRTTIKTYHLKSNGAPIVSGKAVGHSIVSGIARIIADPKEGYKLKEGEILVTDTTSPDWNTILKKASVIVTNKGGRTSHASIVARELGLSAVVGTTNGTELIKDGEQITVSCAEGDIGKIPRKAPLGRKGI